MLAILTGKGSLASGILIAWIRLQSSRLRLPRLVSTRGTVIETMVIAPSALACDPARGKGSASAKGRGNGSANGKATASEVIESAIVSANESARGYEIVLVTNAVADALAQGNQPVRLTTVTTRRQTVSSAQSLATAGLFPARFHIRARPTRPAMVRLPRTDNAPHRPLVDPTLPACSRRQIAQTSRLCRTTRNNNNKRLRIILRLKLIIRVRYRRPTHGVHRSRFQLRPYQS